MNLRVQSFDDVTSTNNLIKAAIDAGESEGLVIRALQQNAGYGRQGRGWKSPLGGLYCSWLLKPQVPLLHVPTLSLVAGLAVQKACCSCVQELAGDFGFRQIAVKWPNDVVVVEAGEPEFKKLCGISTEAYHGAICVGIGINVCSPDFAAELSLGEQSDVFNPIAATETANSAHNVGVQTATALQIGNSSQAIASDTGRVPFYLSSFCLDSGASIFENMTLSQTLDRVFDALSSALVPAYERWCQVGFDCFTKDFNERNMLSGKSVALANNLGDVLYEGVVLGVNDDGTLRLQQPDGHEIAASSGEVHVRVSLDR